MTIMAVSATPAEDRSASSRSVVNVAMPQRRGRALPTNAIRSERAEKSSHSFPFGFVINSLTGDTGGLGPVLGFSVLGLRISRLLRFCDLAISTCPPSFSQAEIGRASCRERVCQYV